MNNHSFKQAALEYATAGFNVFPLVPGGKTPACEHGFYDATADASQIEAWWTENPDYNIGILPGDGIIVIDLDINHGNGTKDGLKVLEDYERKHGAFPPTASCRTARGGRHLYYRVNNTVKTQVDLYPGVDICGDLPGTLVLPDYQHADRINAASDRALYCFFKRLLCAMM